MKAESKNDDIGWLDLELWKEIKIRMEMWNKVYRLV